MFVTKSEGSGANVERSRYGKPQHEEDAGNGWETEYYGDPNDGEPPGSIEFVPDVERRGMFDEDGEARSRPPESRNRSRARTIDRIAP